MAAIQTPMRPMTGANLQACKVFNQKERFMIYPESMAKGGQECAFFGEGIT